MIIIVKSKKDIWYNRGNVLQDIGNKLVGTDGAEYIYTIAHTSKETYTLRCNSLDAPRAGLIRLPNTSKGLSNISDIENELARYRRVDDLIEKWNSQTKQQRDTARLTYIIGKMHYKALCKEYGVKCYDKSKRSGDSATGIAMFWVLRDISGDHIYNRVQQKVRMANYAKERKEAELARVAELERIAYEQRIHSRSEILDLRPLD